MMIRLMAVLVAMAVMAVMGCSDDAQTEPAGVTPAEMAASERTVEAKRTAFALEQETPTPTVPVQAAVMPARTQTAREAAAVGAVETPVVLAQPTVEPTATAEPTVVAVETATPATGGEVDEARIPRDILIEAFEEALGDMWWLMGHHKNVSEVSDDTEFAWPELSWGELTYVRKDHYIDTIVVSVFGNGVGEDVIPGSGKEVHDLYRDDGAPERLRVSGDEIWRDEHEDYRNLLDTVFHGNLAEMGLERVDILAHIDTYSPYVAAPPGDDDGLFHISGELEFDNISDVDVYGLFFSRAGYHIWIVHVGTEWSFSQLEFVPAESISILGSALDATLLRLLDEYP